MKHTVYCMSPWHYNIKSLAVFAIQLGQPLTLNISTIKQYGIVWDNFKMSILYGSRTTPNEDNSPPDKNKAQPLPTRTTIPRTIPHQDNSPLGPLPRNKTTHQDQNLYGGELSSWGVVRIRTVYMRNLTN